jgi:hypothetical protein
MSLSRNSCQGWPGAFPASFLLPLYFLVYVSSYSLGPYPRIDCYFRLRSLTLRQGKLPIQWNVAKIVLLKKGNKDDYTLPKNYRPISLLVTLEKVMEAVMATRIAYLTEVHKLLPNNHFGARKQKSTVLAISYLQEAIYDA